MAHRNAKWTFVLSSLSQDVPDNVYSKLKAFNDVTAKESPLWVTFVRFRQQGNNALQHGLPDGWEGSEDELYLATIHYIIRLRRNRESWRGQELHELLGGIRWGISNGVGEDLLDFIGQAKDIAAEENSIGFMLQLLRLERITAITYSDSGEARIAHLKTIFKERGRLLAICRNGVWLGTGTKAVKVRTRKPHRVKSDLLFRLSKTLTDEEFELLRQYLKLHSKDAKQIRLVEYYRGLDLWSKQREQIDWQGEKLAQLKNRTLLWLMRKMGMLGGWQGMQLHDLIGDILWCISKGVDYREIGLFEMAERLAIGEEGDEELITLLELKKLGEIDGGSLLALGAENALARLTEIEEVHDFRIEYFEQIKRVNAKTGTNTPEGWRRLLDAFTVLKPDQLMTGEALRETYLLRMLAATSLGLHSLAVNMGQSLIELYQRRSYLASSNWKRHFKELWAISHSFSIGERPDLAEVVIDRMDALSRLSPNLLVQSAILKLLALSHLYHVKREKLLAEQVWEHFQKAKPILAFEGEEKNLVWLHFFIAKVCLELRDYQEAIGILNQIIDQKARTSKVILAHSRLMLLLCYLGVKTEVEVVFDASTACTMFLHRQEGLPAYLHSISKAIKKIASFDYGSKEQIAAFDLAIRQAKTAYLERGGNQTIDPPYHLILEQLICL